MLFYKFIKSNIIILVINDYCKNELMNNSKLAIIIKIIANNQKRWQIRKLMLAYILSKEKGEKYVK